ncbi:MAG: polysaccharide biosynthesis C-terminal domain-containing protein, partial [Acidobacteria bacterium]|nr:polysaccharide biosynthesis C-terminal domain-containing protein [Acidobacteriota bacterium]
QWGLVVAALASVPIAVAWIYTGPLLRFTGQDPALSEEAHRYLLVQIPCVPCYLGFLALRQWLQGRGITRPVLWIAILANLVNVVADYILIYGALGVPALGTQGAGIATALSQGFMLLGLALVVRRHRLYRGGWEGWSRQAFDRRGLGAVFGHGWPVATQLGLELWAFSG